MQSIGAVGADGDGELPGLDLDAFAAYFTTHCPDAARGPLTARVIAGGKSNLTYEINDSHTTWILRRPPLGHVLATAHDMGREHRVISALATTPVPVPATLLLCDDPDVLGAPFFVMEKVEGSVFRRSEHLRPLGAERTRRIAEAAIHTLVALHAVRPTEVGLSDFGRPQGYLWRQVRRWKSQADASHHRELAGMAELHARLERSVPEETAATIVHGDFRIDNLVVDSEDRVAGVLDWEMATQGDPVSDVALTVAYQRMAEADLGMDIPEVGANPGFLTSVEMIDLYARRSGRDLSDIGFYLGLAYFKIAAIFEGIHYRHIHGQTVGQGFDRVGDVVEPVIQLGLAATRGER